PALSGLPGHGLAGIDAQLADRLVDRGPIDLAVVGQRPQRRERNVVAVHFEELAKLCARIRAPEAVGAERDIAARHPLPDLVRHVAHVIRRGDYRALVLTEALL